MSSHNLQECVTKKVEILHNEDPKRPQSQNVAIAYKHCREKMAGDSKDFINSIKYTNQVIACEGVLDYNGKKYAKLWDSLSKQVGKIVPIVDEHPSKQNGNDGKVSANDIIYGYAEIKKCVKGEPVICADIDVDSNAPHKEGYSIGFIYDEIDKPGVIEGSAYDAIQDIQDIDHLALTVAPRNPIAIATDSLQKLQSNTENSNENVVKYRLEYDTFKSFKVIETEKKILKDSGDKKLPKTSEEYEAEIAELKKDKASKDKSGDSLVNSDSDLKRQLQSAEKEKQRFESDAKLYKEKYEKEIAKQLTMDIDSIVEEFPEIKKIEFDGKSRDFVEGMKKLSEVIKNRPTSSIVGSTPVEADSDVEFDSPNDFVYNASIGKMERVKK